MTTTTYPVSGSFGGRVSSPRRQTPAVTAAAAVARTPASRAPRKPWFAFLGNAFATWASAGRVPL